MKWKRKTENDSYASAGKDMVCPQCGKDFFVSCCELYTWKLIQNGERLYFCSYGCRQAKLRSLEAEEAAKEDERREAELLYKRRRYFERKTKEFEKKMKEAEGDDD